MNPVFSLAHLTALSLAPPALADVASRAGYRHVGLRLIGVTAESLAYSLATDKAMRRETKARLAATGVGALDIEIFRLTPEVDVAAFAPAFEAGAELGAKYALSAAYDPDRSRLINRFGALCDLAATFGLSPVLEFFPWTDAPHLAAARSIIEAAGRANAGILVDTLHFARSKSTYQELEVMPAARLPFLHLSDAPAEIPSTTEGLLHTARSERLLPGDGGIDIPAIVRRMPAGIPIALEIPMERLTREVGPEEVARRAIAAARRALGRIESRR